MFHCLKPSQKPGLLKQIKITLKINIYSNNEDAGGVQLSNQCHETTQTHAEVQDNMTDINDIIIEMYDRRLYSRVNYILNNDPYPLRENFDSLIIKRSGRLRPQRRP